MPAELLELIPRSYDIIGSIAILELNRDIQQTLEPFIPLIGSTLLEHHPALDCRFYEGWRCRGDISNPSISGVLQEMKIPLQYIKKMIAF